MMTAFDLAGLKIHQSLERIVQKSRYIMIIMIIIMIIILALPQREWSI